MLGSMKENPVAQRFIIDIQNNVAGAMRALLPEKIWVRRWVRAVFMQESVACAELTVRFVDEPEMIALNTQYRGQPTATNVLSFVATLPDAVILEVPFLGDVVLCAPVIAREAQAETKPLVAHWAHLILHGTLHLLGYDHQTAEEAQCMESKEITLLQQWNYPNPYLESVCHER